MRFYNDCELMKVSDKELKEIFLSLRAKINIAKKKNSLVKEEEIYYCYVCREIQRRPKLSMLTK